MGYVLAGASLSKLVLAHNYSHIDKETLGEKTKCKYMADCHVKRNLMGLRLMWRRKLESTSRKRVLRIELMIRD